MRVSATSFSEMLNTVRLLVIYFGVNLHDGQVYFLLLSNPKKQIGGPEPD